MKTAVPGLCHEGNVLVIEKGNLRIHGGGIARGARPKDGWIVIDLAGEDSCRPVTISGDLPFPRLATVGPSAVIQINWLDFGVPNLDRGFWEKLVADLEDISAVRPTDVLVMCLGGHGRTGTALAILGSLLGVIPASECPVRWVRANYCQRAVETAQQALYVADVTGREVSELSAPHDPGWDTDMEEWARWFGHCGGLL